MREELEYASRYVIVNADDFGRSEKINNAIIRAHTHGILTSASIMMGEPAFDHALKLAWQYESLGVGLHLTLSEGIPVLNRSRIAPILLPNGRLSPDLFMAGLRYSFNKQARQAIVAEMGAQMDRFEELCPGKSHIDGHQHFHMHPVLWDAMLSLCKEFGFRNIRVPREEMIAHFRTGGRGVTLDTVAAIFFRVLARRNLKKLRDPDFFVCDRVYGMLQTGRMTSEYTLSLIDRLQGYTNEIYFHPGSDYAAKLPETQRHDGVDDVEYAALLDPRLKERLAERNVAIGSYWEIREAIARVAGHTP